MASNSGGKSAGMNPRVFGAWPDRRGIQRDLKPVGKAPLDREPGRGRIRTLEAVRIGRPRRSLAIWQFDLF